LFQNDFGVGNALLANLKAVQKRHHLPLSDAVGERHFCVEMEAGTDKTYVYTKTMLELNRRYGFTKFIVVEPSVAIREGVLKSLQIPDEYCGGAVGGYPRCRLKVFTDHRRSFWPGL
jgi:type III restriction enzyme